MNTELVIRTRGLTRYFGDRPAVHGLDLDVPRGCVFAFLGRNGSGKTTTIRMLLGLLPPTRGEGEILGCDIRALSPEIQGADRVFDGGTSGLSLDAGQGMWRLSVAVLCALEREDLPRGDRPFPDRSHDARQGSVPRRTGGAVSGSGAGAGTGAVGPGRSGVGIGSGGAAVVD